MPIGDATLRKIVAAVGEHISEELRVVGLEAQLVGEDLKKEIIRLREEADRERRGDPTPVPSGMLDRGKFWMHLLGLLASVGMRFDDLYSFVIRKGAKKK